MTTIDLTKCPVALEHWTADEVAECIPYEDDDKHTLAKKLWGFLHDAKNKTPSGGDGTDGTVEYPDARYNPENDDKAPHWWGKLTDDEKLLIIAGWTKDFGDIY